MQPTTTAVTSHVRMHLMFCRRRLPTPRIPSSRRHSNKNLITPFRSSSRLTPIFSVRRKLATHPPQSVPMRFEQFLLFNDLLSSCLVGMHTGLCVIGPTSAEGCLHALHHSSVIMGYVEMLRSAYLILMKRFRVMFVCIDDTMQSFQRFPLG